MSILRLDKVFIVMQEAPNDAGTVSVNCWAV